MSDMEDQPVDMFSYDAENYKPNWVFRPRTHPQPSTETGQGAENPETALVSWNAKEDREISIETVDDRENLVSRVKLLENQIVDISLARLDDANRIPNNSLGPSMISKTKQLEAVDDARRVLESEVTALRYEKYHVKDKLNRVHNDIDRAEDKLNRAEDELSRVQEETSRELKHREEKISEMDKTLADMFEKLRIGSAQLTHDDGSQALMETHPLASAQPLPRYVPYSILFRQIHG
jgi:chromosome segregation ATPase